MRTAYFFHSVSRLLTGLLLACAVLWSPAAALAGDTAEIARVISLTPEAWAERAAGRTELALKSSLFRADAVGTNASGKVQLLFNDDTTVAVAPGSHIRLEDFVVDGANSRFGMRLSGGMARVVTGKVVKLNPEGFTVTTAQAVVGIRGTDCTIMADGRKTTVIANRIHTKDIRITNIATGKISSISRTGMAVDVAPGGSTLRQATEQERTTATQAMRQLPQQTFAVALSSQATTQERQPQTPPALEQKPAAQEQIKPTTPSKPAPDPEEPPAPPVDPAPPIDPPVDPTPPIDPPVDPPTPPVNPSNPNNISGGFSGSLVVNSGSGASGGNFQFNVNLGTGTVSDAYMGLHASDNTQVFGAYDGSGAINGANFSVNTWGAARDYTTNSVVNPSLNGSFASDNILTGVNWSVADGGGNTLWSGTGSGFNHHTDPHPAVPDLFQNISAAYFGDLAGDLSGNFQFNVALTTGRISDAALAFYNNGSSTYVAGFYDGTGRVAADRSFIINNGWVENGALGSLYTPNLSGKFKPDGNLTNVTWELLDKNNPGNIQFSGQGNATPQLPQADPRLIQGTYNMDLLSADKLTKMGSLGFNVVLGSGKISDGTMNADGMFKATGGYGNINADRSFLVNQWGGSITRYNGYNSIPEFWGSFNKVGNGLKEINWKP